MKKSGCLTHISISPILRTYSWEVENKLCKGMQFPCRCWQSNFQMQQKSWRPTGIYLINSFSPQRIRLQLQTTLRPDVIYWSRRMVMYKKVTIVDLQNNSLGVVFWVNTVICVLRSFMEDLYRNTSSKNTRKDLKCRQFFIFCVFPPKLKDTYICCGYWKNKKKWKLVRAPFFS